VAREPAAQGVGEAGGAGTGGHRQRGRALERAAQGGTAAGGAEPGRDDKD